MGYLSNPCHVYLFLFFFWIISIWLVALFCVLLLLFVCFLIQLNHSTSPSPARFEPAAAKVRPGDLNATRTSEIRRRRVNVDYCSLSRGEHPLKTSDTPRPRWKRCPSRSSERSARGSCIPFAPPLQPGSRSDTYGDISRRDYFVSVETF